MADPQDQLRSPRCVEESTEDQGPLLESLVLLWVAEDSVKAVGDSKAEDAIEIAAGLRG